MSIHMYNTAIHVGRAVLRDSIFWPYLLNTWLLQGATQTLAVGLVIPNELIQSGKGDLLRHKVGADHRPTDTIMIDLTFISACWGIKS